MLLVDEEGEIFWLSPSSGVSLGWRRSSPISSMDSPLTDCGCRDRGRSASFTLYVAARALPTSTGSGAAVSEDSDGMDAWLVGLIVESGFASSRACSLDTDGGSVAVGDSPPSSPLPILSRPSVSNS